MDSERQYNIKQKLEALDSLPAEAFDKENAWEKLHHRLQKNPKRKKAFWYWMAAACLLPIVAMILFINTKKEIVLVKNDAAKPIIQLKKDDAEKIIVTTTLPPEENQTIKNNPPALRSFIQHNNTRPKNNEPAIASNQTVIEKIPETATKIIAPADTSKNTAALFIIKRKLRVVCINELEAPAFVTPDQTASSNRNEQPKIKHRLINNHSFNTANADQPQQEYTGGIKIPLNNN